MRVSMMTTLVDHGSIADATNAPARPEFNPSPPFA